MATSLMITTVANNDEFKKGDYISISSYEVMRIDSFKHIPGDDCGTLAFEGPSVGYLCGYKIYNEKETMTVPAMRLDMMIYKISIEDFKKRAAWYISVGNFPVTVDDLL